MRRRVFMTASAGLLCLGTLAGCGSAQEAVQAGAAVAGVAQELGIDTGLVGAAADLAAACTTAAAAWVPGVSGAEARSAIAEALALAERGMAEAQIPGGEAVVAALEETQVAMQGSGDGSVLGVPQGVLGTACALFMAGG